MENLLNLDNKVALVTGGSQGIGRSIAFVLAEAGAAVAITDIDKDNGEKTVKEIAAQGGTARFYHGSVTDGGSVDEMVSSIVKDLGSIDVLVNNAGITKDGLIMRMKDDQWDDVISINLKGAFNCLRAVTKYMMKQRYGSIINMSSVIGVMGNAGQANYAASKAGLIGLTKSAAKEFASRNIRVNAIAPGFIRTRMTELLAEDVKQSYMDSIPLKRLGEPEDVAKLILFLASDAGSYITGQVINIDGGLVM
ncbi:3-oxoacyl-[acyl-carrier-protein] reductase [candidate division KSB1 bacterium]